MKHFLHTFISMTTFDEHLAAKITDLGTVADRLGMPIDPEILPAVAVLQLAGFHTTGSCAGHPERASACPWVDIAMPDRPERQQGATSKKAEIHRQLIAEGVNNPDLSGKSLDLFRLWLEHDKPPEHPDFQPWLRQSLKLTYGLFALLETYHQQCPFNPGQPRLYLNVMAQGRCRLTVLDAHSLTDELTKHARQPTPELVARLHARRACLQSFVDWLAQHLRTGTLPR